MASHVPVSRRSGLLSSLVVLERTDDDPQLGRDVGAEVSKPAEPIVFSRAIERTKPFPHGIQLGVKRNATRRRRFDPIEHGPERIGRERGRVRRGAERIHRRVHGINELRSIDRCGVRHVRGWVSDVCFESRNIAIDR
jgi:hypothetical protein